MQSPNNPSQTGSTNSAIITFLSLAAVVFATAIVLAYRQHTDWMVTQLSIQAMLCVVAVIVGYKIFKH